MAFGYIEGNGTWSPEWYKEFDDYYSNLKVVFLESLASQIDQVNIPILTRIDNDFNLTTTLDPEVKQRWLPLGIKKGYENATEPAHQFVSSMGRLKYLKPIYLALE